MIPARGGSRTQKNSKFAHSDPRLRPDRESRRSAHGL
nr:MAG TPA: hypothetical protein [Caudoviricetes sp.]